MLFPHYTIRQSTHLPLRWLNVTRLQYHPSIYTSTSPSTQCYSPTTPSIYLHIYLSVDLMSLAYNTIHLSTRLSLHPPNVFSPLHHPLIYTSTSPLTWCHSPTIPSIYLQIYLSIHPMLFLQYTIHLSTNPALHTSNISYPQHHSSVYASSSLSYIVTHPWSHPSTHPPNVIPPQHHPTIHPLTIHKMWRTHIVFQLSWSFILQSRCITCRSSIFPSVFLAKEFLQFYRFRSVEHNSLGFKTPLWQ